MTYNGVGGGDPERCGRELDICNLLPFSSCVEHESICQQGLGKFELGSLWVCRAGCVPGRNVLNVLLHK